MGYFLKKIILKSLQSKKKEDLMKFILKEYQGKNLG